MADRIRTQGTEEIVRGRDMSPEAVAQRLVDYAKNPACVLTRTQIVEDAEANLRTVKEGSRGA